MAAEDKKDVKKPSKDKCIKEDKKCPINEYVNNRLEELENEIDASLNPLDRIELRSRYDELKRLEHFVIEYSLKGIIEVVLEHKIKKDA